MNTSSRGKRALAIGSVIGLLALSTTLRAEEKKKPAPAPATPPPPQRVVPRSVDAIAYLFHGEYMNANGAKIAKPTPEALKAFRDAKTAGKTQARAVENPRDQAAYCRACVAAGVPEPPSFSSGKWKSKGSLAKDSQFASSNVKDIMVYESANPPGVCVALPRGEGNDIELLGVICQGEKSGKACFWDNIDSKSGDRIVGPDVKKLDIAKFQNGDQLDEDCTECHRGDNVYLVHDELEQIPSRDPENRYEPIPTGAHTNGDFWSNPDRTRDDDPNGKNQMGGGCGSCHAMPSMSEGYCDAVLSNAVSRGVMPPSDTLDSDDRDEDTCRDVCLLHYECTKNNYGDGLSAQVASDVCDCDTRWWPELSKIPPKAKPN